jgi:hypothetical protein
LPGAGLPVDGDQSHGHGWNLRVLDGDGEPIPDSDRSPPAKRRGQVDARTGAEVTLPRIGRVIQASVSVISTRSRK